MEKIYTGKKIHNKQPQYTWAQSTVSSSSGILDQFSKMGDDELDNHVRALQQLKSKRDFAKVQK